MGIKRSKIVKLHLINTTTQFWAHLSQDMLSYTLDIKHSSFGKYVGLSKLVDTWKKYSEVGFNYLWSIVI